MTRGIYKGMVYQLVPNSEAVRVLPRPLSIEGMKTVWGGCRMWPERPKIEAEGRERVWSSWGGAASPLPTS